MRSHLKLSDVSHSRFTGDRFQRFPNDDALQRIFHESPAIVHPDLTPLPQRGGYGASAQFARIGRGKPRVAQLDSTPVTSRIQPARRDDFSQRPIERLLASGHLVSRTVIGVGSHAAIVQKIPFPDQSQPDQIRVVTGVGIFAEKQNDAANDDIIRNGSPGRFPGVHRSGQPGKPRFREFPPGSRVFGRQRRRPAENQGADNLEITCCQCHQRLPNRPDDSKPEFDPPGQG